MHLRANPALMELLQAPPDPDRKCPYRAVGQDRFCFRRHPDLPSTLPQTPDRDYSSGLADGIPPAWLSAMPNTVGYGRPQNGFGASRPGLPALRIQAPGACKSWWLGQ